jgi:hypothetical protein
MNCLYTNELSNLRLHDTTRRVPDHEGVQVENCYHNPDQVAHIIKLIDGSSIFTLPRLLVCRPPLRRPPCQAVQRSGRSASKLAAVLKVEPRRTLATAHGARTPRVKCLARLHALRHDAVMPWRIVAA